MNVGSAKTDMSEVVASLRHQLDTATGADARDEFVCAAKEQIAKIRKQHKRRIDKRASGWFPIHQISGAESKLAEITQSAIDAIELECRRQR